MNRARYATLGNISIDDLVFADGTTKWCVPGGNAIYSGLGMAVWGERPQVIAPIGPDYPAGGLGDRIDLGRCRPLARSLRDWGLYEEDGTRQFVFRSKTRNWLDFCPTVADLDGSSCTYAHLAPLPWHRHVELAEALRARGAELISADPDDRRLSEVSRADLKRLLGLVDMFMPSRQDADAMFPGRAPLDALRALRDLAPDLPVDRHQVRRRRRDRAPAGRAGLRGVAGHCRGDGGRDGRRRCVLRRRPRGVLAQGGPGRGAGPRQRVRFLCRRGGGAGCAPRAPRPRSPREGSTASWTASSCTPCNPGNRRRAGTEAPRRTRIGRREEDHAAGDRHAAGLRPRQCRGHAGGDARGARGATCTLDRQRLHDRLRRQLLCGACRAQLRHGRHRADGGAGRGARVLPLPDPARSVRRLRLRHLELGHRVAHHRGRGARPRAWRLDVCRHRQRGQPPGPDGRDAGQGQRRPRISRSAPTERAS